MNKDCDDIEFKPVDRLISQKSRNFIYDLFLKNLTSEEESKTINFQEFPLIVQCLILSMLTHKDFINICLFFELKLLYCKHRYFERIYEERCKSWFPLDFIKFKAINMKWEEFYFRMNYLFNKIDCYFARIVINSKLIRKNKLMELQIINSYENDYNMNSQSDFIRRMYLKEAKERKLTEIVKWMENLPIINKETKVYIVSQSRRDEYQDQIEQNYSQFRVNTRVIIDPFYTPNSVTQIVGRTYRFPSINSKQELNVTPVVQIIPHIKNNFIRTIFAQKTKLNTEGTVVIYKANKSVTRNKTNDLIADVD